MRSKVIPNLEERPHFLTIEKQMKATPSELYEAWTTKFDTWFGYPGETMMVAEIDKPFFFYNSPDYGRHAHYGRYLELEKDKVVEMTWVSGKDATFGAETVLRVEFIPKGEGTELRMMHKGFQNESSKQAHIEGWTQGLDVLDQTIQSW